MLRRIGDLAQGALQRSGVRATIYVGLIGVSAIAAAIGAHSLFDQMVMAVDGPVSRVLRAEQGRVEASSGRVTLSQDWHERIRTPDFWRDRARPAPQRQNWPAPGDVRVQRPNLWQSPEPMRRSGEGDGEATYRTVCVRLCDGYFFPVSFATSEDGFARDTAQCEKSCSAPTRLYVYKNPGEDPAFMRTPEGQPYSSLPTANLFRTRYDAQCRCTPQPWHKAELDRHRVYALEAALRKGDRDARQQLAHLKAQQESDRRLLELRRTAALASIRAGSVAVRTPLLPKIAQAPIANSPALVAAPPLVAGVPAIAPPPKGQLAQRPAPVRSAAIGGDLMIMRLGVQPSTSQTVGVSTKRKRNRR